MKRCEVCNQWLMFGRCPLLGGWRFWALLIYRALPFLVLSWLFIWLAYAVI